jgi:hypothetical protein
MISYTHDTTLTPRTRLHGITTVEQVVFILNQVGEPVTDDQKQRWEATVRDPRYWFEIPHTNCTSRAIEKAVKAANKRWPDPEKTPETPSSPSTSATVALQIGEIRIPLTVDQVRALKTALQEIDP